ncbi:MAG TPA: ATP-binding protein [Kofleriaceae bacterium]|nr:ATP-binding protein [Kofleriaceae bacterium]
MSLEQMSREELIAELDKQLAERDGRQQAQDKIVHDLRVYQVELELQNRELRDAQGALEAAKSRFEELYDFAPVAYFTFDPRGVVLEANLSAATLVGRDRTYLIGKPFPALVDMPDRAMFWNHLRRCERERRSVTTEMRFSVGRGEERDVQALSVPVFDVAGRTAAFRTSFTDITQLKRIEGELARSRTEEARLHKQYEQLDRAGLELNQLLTRIDGQGTVIVEVLHKIVEQAAAIAGSEYAALGFAGDSDHPFEPWVSIGMDAEVATAIGHPPRARGLLAEVMRIGRSLRLRDLREHPAFAGFPPNHPEMRGFLGVPVRFGGHVIGHLYLTNKRSGEEFTAGDQTVIEMFAERAGVAIELARLAREVRASVAARDNLLAIVSHDLRGPLSTIRLSAELVTQVAAGRADLQRPVQTIQRSASRMTKLIEDLLQAATIEAGAFTVVLEPHEVAPIVEPVLEMFEASAAERSVRLVSEVPRGLPAIQCDESRIVQVLANLVSNALKFSSVGGCVRIRAWAQGGEVRFSVTDGGPGIPADEMAHLFERYWKGAAESKRGTGLGLFIASGIVAAHHGRIWADSKLADGSTFTFAIPIARQDESHERPA